MRMLTGRLIKKATLPKNKAGLEPLCLLAQVGDWKNKCSLLNRKASPSPEPKKQRFGSPELIPVGSKATWDTT